MKLSKTRYIRQLFLMSLCNLPLKTKWGHFCAEAFCRLPGAGLYLGVCHSRGWDRGNRFPWRTDSLEMLEIRDLLIF